MRLAAHVYLAFLAFTAAACARHTDEPPANEVGWGAAKQVPAPTGLHTTEAVQATTQPVGFDRNDYPGDATMAAMRAHFSFTGYWLTPPPEAKTNSWAGKRAVLREQGWGFLLLANGKLDVEIVKAKKAGISAADLGRKDAATAITAAKSEGFPTGAIIFLDQEEGGRLLPEQAEYLLAWTEAVAASPYKPGLYASGQPVPSDQNITTINDVRARIQAQHLHPVAIFDAQDACPPSNGCTLQPKPLSASGEPDLIAWQYSQSPRRTDITKACAKTYAADGNCYAPGFSSVFLDMDLATSTDPSHGR